MSEELLQLHRSAHIPFDLELARHVGAGRVLLAADDLLERLIGGGYDRVGILPTFGDADLAVPDLDRPLAGAVDVEDVRVRHPGDLRRVRTALEAVEELLHSRHRS